MVFGDPVPVVGEEVEAALDHGRRAPVVHLQGVAGGTGEVAVVVDEETGVGPGVAVDDLVVVADPEAVERRGGQQADEEEVGRGRGPGTRRPAGVRHGPGPRPGPPGRRGGSPRPGRSARRSRPPPASAEGRPVAVEALGQAGGVGDLRLRVLRGDQPQPDGREAVEVGGDGVGVGRPADLEDLLDEVPDLRARRPPCSAVGPPASLQMARPRLFSVRSGVPRGHEVGAPPAGARRPPWCCRPAR